MRKARGNFRLFQIRPERPPITRLNHPVSITPSQSLQITSPESPRPNHIHATPRKDPTMRQLNRDEYLLLKAAARSLIKSCGGLEAAATITRVGVTILSDYGNVEKSECFMPIDVAMDLQRETRCASVTEALAALCGGAFVPKGCDAGQAGGNLMTATADIMAETSDVMNSVAAALQDGRLNNRERQAMVRQVQDIIHACGAALMRMNSFDVPTTSDK